MADRLAESVPGSGAARGGGSGPGSVRESEGCFKPYCLSFALLITFLLGKHSAFQSLLNFIL